jgi:hypothetical protein
MSTGICTKCCEECRREEIDIITKGFKAQQKLIDAIRSGEPIIPDSILNDIARAEGVVDGLE